MRCEGQNILALNRSFYSGEVRGLLVVLKKKLAECPDALKAQELSNALYGLNNLGDTEEVTEATWSGATVARVLSFPDLGVLGDRVSATSLAGCPCLDIGRVVECLKSIGNVWKVVGSSPFGFASVFSTHVRG